MTHVQSFVFGFSFANGAVSWSLWGGSLFVNSIGLEQRGLFSSLFSSNALIFFLRDRSGLIHLLQGSFLNVCMPWTVLTVSSTLIVFMGKEHWRNPKKRSYAGFNSQTVVCKNIYAGFIQFLLEDHWKPMWTNWSLILAWCERVMVLSSSNV